MNTLDNNADSPPSDNGASVETSSGVPDFVKKLYRMLEDKSYNHIVSWGITGETFVVKEPNEFAKTILPKHFKHSNFASFVRQLNKYDFHKKRNADDGSKPYGEQAWEFQHPKFQSNKKEELLKIKRKTPMNRPKQPGAGMGMPNASGIGTDGTGIAMPQDDLRLVTFDLQNQVDSLTKLQQDMAQYLSHLSRNYHLVVEEVLNFRKNMIAQDQLMQNMVQYLVTQENERQERISGSHNQIESSSSASTSVVLGPSDVPFVPSHEAQKLINSYSEVAKASFQQMNEISKRVQNMQTMGSNSEQFNETDSYFPSTKINASEALTGPHVNQEGLTVVTVGHLTPKREQNIDIMSSGITLVEEPSSISESSAPVPSTSSSVPSSSSMPKKKKSMRVERRTYVPGWAVPPKVLLVDDDKVCLKLSSKFLNIAGCTYDVAVDGLDALNKLNLEKYDLVLMDIVMPNLDGISATSQWRQIDTRTPIISMTSNTTDSDIMQYVASGMNDVLQKPFSEKAIVNLLEKHCGHLKAMQQWMNQSGNSPFLSRELSSPDNELVRINPSHQLQSPQSPSNGFENMLPSPDFASMMSFLGNGSDNILNPGQVHSLDDYDYEDERGPKRAKLELLE